MTNTSPSTSTAIHGPRERLLLLRNTAPLAYCPARERTRQSRAAPPGFIVRQSGKPDSNRRPQPWQGCALPTELFPHAYRPKLEPPRGPVNAVRRPERRYLRPPQTLMFRGRSRDRQGFEPTPVTPQGTPAHGRLMRRSLALALLIALPAGDGLAAQLLDDAMVPRGRVRLQMFPVYTSWDSRFGRSAEGVTGREALGGRPDGRVG